MADTSSLIKQYKPSFDRDGWIVVRGFYSPTEIGALTAHLDKFIRDVVPHIPPTDAFYEVKGKPETLKQMQNMAKHDDLFGTMPKSERFEGLASGLFGRAAVSQGSEWFNKPARVGAATPPHQDGYYFMLEPNEALTFWLAMDNVDEANGCIRYVTGSHKKGLRPHGRTQTLGFSQGIMDYGPADQANEALMIVKPGDLLIHHGLTIHRADANTSDRSRRALGMVYYSERAKADRQRQLEYQKKLTADLAAAGKI